MTLVVIIQQKQSNSNDFIEVPRLGESNEYYHSDSASHGA